VLANGAHLAADHRGIPRAASPPRRDLPLHSRRPPEGSYLGAKVEAPVGSISHRDLEDFLQHRLQKRSPTKVGKERDSLLKLFVWATARSYVRQSPAVMKHYRRGMLRGAFR
jgi:hypothetical protein